MNSLKQLRNNFNNHNTMGLSSNDNPTIFNRSSKDNIMFCSDSGFKVFWRYYKCLECSYAFSYILPKVCPNCNSNRIDTMLETKLNDSKITFILFDVEDNF
jgi:hypothetical protein